MDSWKGSLLKPMQLDIYTKVCAEFSLTRFVWISKRFAAVVLCCCTEA